MVTIRMASQAVAFHHRGVAAVLGLPPDKVRLVHVSPGGGFGARNDLSLHPYLALAALHTRRPVKMVLTRSESLRFHTKRHAMEHTVRLGATRDGRLVSLTCDILADTGAYSSAGIPVLDQATLFATGPYDVPNVRIKGLSVYTNNVACGAMRGFGIPQSAFAVEYLMDELAEKLAMSPFELRRLNGLQVGSSTATGQVLESSVPFRETLDRAEQALAAAEWELPPPASGHKRGVGVASCYKNVGLGLGLPEPTGVGIDLTPGGRILIRFGGAELGQGADTVVAQMAAQALGVPYSLVDVLGCDTALTPDGGITSASRTTFMSGNAVVEAAPLFLQELRAAMPDGAPLNPESLARLGEHVPHLLIMGWMADYPDPDNFLRARIDHIQQQSGWRNEGYDSLVKQAQRSLDQGERIKLYGEAEQILAEEAPIMPIFHTSVRLLVKPWVTRFPTTGLREWFFKDVIIKPH